LLTSRPQLVFLGRRSTQTFLRFNSRLWRTRLSWPLEILPFAKNVNPFSTSTAKLKRRKMVRVIKCGSVNSATTKTPSTSRRKKSQKVMQ